MAKKASVHSVHFAVTFDSSGLKFKAPPNTQMKFHDYGNGTYHLTALPDDYEIATGNGRKKPPKKKPARGTTKKKK